MNTRPIDTRLDESRNKLDFGADSTIEVNAIKKVVRENWESRLKERGTNLDILNRHAEFMTKELGSMDYEALCLQNIAAHSKHMSRGELLSYVNITEALTIGYKSKFGLDISRLLIAGVTLVSRDLRTMTKHFDYFIAHLSKNSSLYLKLMEREIKKVEDLDAELRKKDSGILRFLRKRQIVTLRKRIKLKQAKISKLEKKKGRYDSLTASLKVKATPHLRNK